MFVPMKDIVDAAYAGKYGVPAVPSNDEVQIRAAIQAAVESRSPLIFLTNNRKDPHFTHYMIKRFADEVDVPVASCLDHSRTFEDCVLGVSSGCSAIMADRSTLPYEENVADVLRLAQIAHAVGVSIEAELGHVGQGDNYAVDGVSALTDPEEAKRFIADTGVDCLAVAVGTAHGAYVGTPKIDFERLKDIDAACQHPLVLHGGSGSGEDNIHRCCELGVAKVNVVNDVMRLTLEGLKNTDLSGNKAYGLYAAINDITVNIVKHLFEVTGSVGKAASCCCGSKASASEGNPFDSTKE